MRKIKKIILAVAIVILIAISISCGTAYVGVGVNVPGPWVGPYGSTTYFGPVVVGRPVY